MTKANADMAKRTTGALSSHIAMNGGGIVDRDLRSKDLSTFFNIQTLRNIT